MAKFSEIFEGSLSNEDEDKFKLIIDFLGLSEQNTDFVFGAYDVYAAQSSLKVLSIQEYISKAVGIILQQNKNKEKKYIELVQFFSYNNLAQNLGNTGKIKLQEKILGYVELVISDVLIIHDDVLDLSSLGLMFLNKKISNLKQLRFLDLSDNYIKETGVLSGLLYLEELNLSYNQIENIDSLSNLTSLLQLDLTKNLIADVHPLVTLKKLKKLFLANNKLARNLDNLATLPYLELLDLRYNIINEDHLKQILRLPFLREIYLMGTGVGAPIEIIEAGDANNIRMFYASEPRMTEKVLDKIAHKEELIEAVDLTGKSDTVVLKEESVLFEEIKNPDEENGKEKNRASEPEDVLRNPMGSFSLFSKPEKNLFDTEKLTEIFRDLIINSEKSEEQFFGLFGRWGRGKTYFWNLLKERINKENTGYYTIEFHAWKYQDTPAIWAYLYDTIAEKYYNKPKKWFSLSKWTGYLLRIVKLNYIRDRLLPSIFLLIFKIGFSFLVFLFTTEFVPSINGVEYDKIIGFCLATPISAYAIYEFFNRRFKASAQQILEKLTKKINFDSHLGIQHEIQKELAALLKSWIPKVALGKERVLLFVDDIDRCSEIKIIQIVDYIRVLLHHEEIEKRMTVLAAIDERILIHAIKNKYNSFIVSEGKKSSNSEERQDMSRDDRIKQQLCREYIDKLFIASLKLGPLTDFERTEIVDGFTLNLTKPRPDPNELTKASLKSEDALKANTDLNNVDLKEQYPDVTLEGQVMKNLRPRDEKSLSQLLNENEGQNRSKKSTGINEEKFVMDIAEQVFLKWLFTNHATDATPRSIRVFTLRYLLGKRLIEKPLKSNRHSYRQWYLTTEGKEYFSVLLLKYSFDEYSNTETLESDYKDFLNKFAINIRKDERGKFDPQIDYKNTVYGIDFSIRPELASIIYQVLSMVVAY